MKFSGRQFIAAAALAALVIGILPVPAVMAGSDLKNAGAGVNRALVGTVAWSNPGNITIQDSNYAKAVLGPLGTSHYLVARNFGFHIPTDAPIVGIQAVFLRKASSTVSIKDSVVSLLIGGNVAGGNRADATKWANAFMSASYGGPDDLWGATISAADINMGNFGVVLSVANTNASLGRTASVNVVRMSVTYGVASTTGVSCASPAMYGNGTLCTVTVTRTVGFDTPSGTVSWTSRGTSPTGWASRCRPATAGRRRLPGRSIPGPTTSIFRRERPRQAAIVPKLKAED